MTDEIWMRNFIKLKNFLINGYPQINSNDESERSLAEFVRSQREEYKNKTMPKYRVKLLNDIHFRWGYDIVKDESIDTWQQFSATYIQELINRNGARMKKNGEYKINKLVDWEREQRKQEIKGDLEEDRQYELEKVGFYFDDSKTPKSERRSDWFKNYNMLIKLLKSVDGDYDRLKTLEGFNKISNWFNRQILEEQKGGLEDYRRILLENIAFPFESKYKNEQ